GRDSAQVATRVTPSPPSPCLNSIPAPKRAAGFQVVDHCGGVSVWDVSSGGRMGGVFGEDATEVAPPPTTLTHQGPAPNQVPGPRPGHQSRRPVPRARGEPPPAALSRVAPVGSGGVRLTLDHVILRAANPAAVVAELSERAGAPVLVAPHDTGAFVSGIVRA